MRKAEFSIVWSFWIWYGEVLGNQMGGACMKRDRIRDTYVISMVLICWPQLVQPSSKGLEDVDTGWSPGNYRFDMGIEFEVMVEGHS